jgi:hypothetical protein
MQTFGYFYIKSTIALKSNDFRRRFNFQPIQIYQKEYQKSSEPLRKHDNFRVIFNFLGLVCTVHVKAKMGLNFRVMVPLKKG